MTMAVPSPGSLWPWPVACLPDLTSAVPCYYRPDMGLSLVTITGLMLIPTCRLTFQVDLRPASSLWAAQQSGLPMRNGLLQMCYSGGLPTGCMWWSPETLLWHNPKCFLSPLKAAVHNEQAQRNMDRDAQVPAVSTQPECTALKLKHKNLFVELICLVDLWDV